MRCCARWARISSTAWRQMSPASMRGCRRDLADDDIAQFLARPQAAGARRDPAHGRHGRQGRRRGRRRRHQTKTPARAISSSSSTAIPRHDAARLIRIGKELATLPYDYQRHAGRQRAICRSRRAGRAGRPARPRQRAEADRGKAALYRAADAARHHAAIAARRAGAARFHHRRGRRFLRCVSGARARSAIAASPRNPARASTSRSSTRRARPNGARTARSASSPART